METITRMEISAEIEEVKLTLKRGKGKKGGNQRMEETEDKS